MTSPNILIVMTDEERYPPPYETETVRAFRRDHLPARESLRAGGVEFHRHYAGSTACLPSRTTLFTGQYPSLHGASQTDGLAKKNTDPAMSWLDPSSVPTLGDWFRAGGYHTHYRGKWHISHADLFIPGTHDGLMASDDEGKVIADAVEAYRKADRLDPFGFSGWIGREPHGAAKSDCGAVRDGVFAEQVVELFAELAAARARGPVAGCRLVRQPPRHQLRPGGLASAPRVRSARRFGAGDPRGPVTGRRVRRSAAVPGAVQGGVAEDAVRHARPTSPTGGSTTSCTRSSTRRSAGSSKPSTTTVSPTTPSSCSPPTTATCSAPTAD